LSPEKLQINVKSSSVKKEIHGSGKAPFPGEKRITDESPRMEEDEEEMDMTTEEFYL
jgi:hypothetical protein